MSDAQSVEGAPTELLQHVDFAEHMHHKCRLRAFSFRQQSADSAEELAWASWLSLCLCPTGSHRLRPALHPIGGIPPARKTLVSFILRFQNSCMRKPLPRPASLSTRRFLHWGGCNAPSRRRRGPAGGQSCTGSSHHQWKRWRTRLPPAPFRFFLDSLTHVLTQPEPLPQFQRNASFCAVAARRGTQVIPRAAGKFSRFLFPSQFCDSRHRQCLMSFWHALRASLSRVQGFV